MLGIEKCLLNKLPSIFSPTTVTAHDDTVVQAIAAEPEDLKDERESLARKLDVLNRTLSTLNRLDKRGFSGMFLGIPRIVIRFTGLLW